MTTPAQAIVLEPGDGRSFSIGADKVLVKGSTQHDGDGFSVVESLHMSGPSPGGQVREVLEFDFGVRVYPPPHDGGYWRVRWDERRKRKDTTAPDRSAAIAKEALRPEGWGRAGVGPVP